MTGITTLSNMLKVGTISSVSVDLVLQRDGVTYLTGSNTANGPMVQLSQDLKLYPNVGSKPACVAARYGFLWMESGASTDVLWFCSKLSGNPVWRTVSTV